MSSVLFGDIGVETSIPNKRYYGFMNIAGSKLEHEISFKIPLSQLMDEQRLNCEYDPPVITGATWRSIVITIAKENAKKNITLSPVEEEFFIKLLLPIVVRHYFQMQQVTMEIEKDFGTGLQFTILISEDEKGFLSKPKFGLHF
jgi:hypothetical protein